MTVDSECRVFQEKWRNYNFFVEVKGKQVRLLCGDAFAVKREFLSLQAMDGTTKGVDLFKQVVLGMDKFELSFEKLSGLATDGASGMLGPRKGLTALIKKESSLSRSKLSSCMPLNHTSRESVCTFPEAPKCNNNCRFQHKFHQKQRA